MLALTAGLHAWAFHTHSRFRAPCPKPPSTCHHGQMPRSWRRGATTLSTPALNGTPRRKRYPSAACFRSQHRATDLRVDYLARTPGATVFLTPTAAVFSIAAVGKDGLGQATARPPRHSSPEGAGAAVYMHIVGADPDSVPIAEQQLPGTINYFVGNDPTAWQTGITTVVRGLPRRVSRHRLGVLQ